MDYAQSMADFKEDDNGMYKRYFSFCDLSQSRGLSVGCPRERFLVIMSPNFSAGDFENRKKFCDIRKLMFTKKS